MNNGEALTENIRRKTRKCIRYTALLHSASIQAIPASLAITKPVTPSATDDFQLWFHVLHGNLVAKKKKTMPTLASTASDTSVLKVRDSRGEDVSP